MSMSGVRISHESPTLLYGVTVSIPDSGSGGGGSNPSGAVYMEFVAEWFRRKFVALVYAGSNPVKLPETVGSSKRSGLQIFNLSTRVRSSYRLRNASIAQW